MLYRLFDVWRREPGRVVRYRCFEVLPEGGYCVQSADFYRATDAPEENAQHERQFIELLFEQAPNERSGVFQTVEQAIAAHDESFS